MAYIRDLAYNSTWITPATSIVHVTTNAIIAKVMIKKIY